MYKWNFSIEDYSLGSIQIHTQNIYGKGAPAYPYLGIPLTLSLKPKELMYKDKQGQDVKYIQHYTLIYLSGELYMRHNSSQIEIAHFQSKPILHCSDRSWDTDFTIDIPLDKYRIEFLEERRKKNIRFRMHFISLISKHMPIPYNKKEKESIVQEMLTNSFDTDFEIPQSHWVDVVLRGLGYGQFKLIEIPIPEKLIPDIYQKALIALQKSQEHFVKGDYDEVVAQCRNAIQLIPEILPLKLSDTKIPSFNEKIKHFLKQHLPILSDSKMQSLEAMIKAIWKLSSIPHHPSPPGYFNRADAETTFIISTALIAYIGKVLKKCNK